MKQLKLVVLSIGALFFTRARGFSTANTKDTPPDPLAELKAEKPGPARRLPLAPAANVAAIAVPASATAAALAGCPATG